MITSKQNSAVKLVRSFKDKKYRDEENSFLVEGVKSLRAAVESGAVIDRVLCTEKILSQITDIPLKGAIIDTVTEDIMDYVSDEVTPQGVVAVVKKPDEKKNPAEIIGDSLFLDGVSDPSNVGAAIRSAAVFGFDSVLIAGGADAYSPKSVRASMGGIFKVKTYTGNRQDLIKKVKTPFIVADMKGENIRNFKRERGKRGVRRTSRSCKIHFVYPYAKRYGKSERLGVRGYNYVCARREVKIKTL